MEKNVITKIKNKKLRYVFTCLFLLWAIPWLIVMYIAKCVFVLSVFCIYGLKTAKEVWKDIN